MDKVSVIIPAYNAENSIKNCLDSVLVQTYKDMEIIIINDGSTDNTLDVITEYTDSRIKIINQNNKGVSAARNLGLEMSTGEFVVFVDSDDSVDCHYIQSQILAMKNYGADLTVCGYYVLDERNTLIGEFPNSRDRLHFVNSSYLSHEEIWLGLIKHWSIGSALWNKMFKTTLIDKLRFDEKLTIGEDLVFMAQYTTKCNTIYYLKEKLYKYFQNPIGAMKSIKYMNKFNPNWITEWEAIKQFDNIVHNEDVPCNELGNNFEQALFEKKVTIADKILINAKNRCFWDDNCSEMRNFLIHSKKVILFNRSMNFRWKIKLLLRY